jgi:hypothetical protein
VRFFLVAAIAGLTLEIFAQWLGKLWYYAYYPTWFYWPALVPSFILYWVMIVETYMAAKALLDKYLQRGGRGEEPETDSEPYVFGLLGTVGAGLFLFGLLRALLLYKFEGGGFLFNPYTMSAYAPPLRYSVLCCVGLWLLMEAALYSRQLPSLLRSTLHGYFVPVLALVAASAVTSLVWESQNAVVHYWVYTHWPWPNLSIFGVQLSVLFTWPTHYLVYLALPAALVPAWARVFFRRPEQPAAKKAKKKVRG